MRACVRAYEFGRCSFHHRGLFMVYRIRTRIVLLIMLFLLFYFALTKAVTVPLTDVDECKTYRGKQCEHRCENTAGSYRCACRPGFVLNADGHSCDGASIGHVLCCISVLFLHGPFNENTLYYFIVFTCNQLHNYYVIYFVKSIDTFDYVTSGASLNKTKLRCL